MSVLLSYASTWDSEPPKQYNNTAKKRIPTLLNPPKNKTLKKTPMVLQNIGEPDEYTNTDENVQDERYNTFKESFQEYSTSVDKNQTENQGKMNYVQNLLNEMTSASPDNDGVSLANFKSVEYPHLDKDNINSTTLPSMGVRSSYSNKISSYTSNDLDHSLSSYRDVYTPSTKMGDAPNFISKKIKVSDNVHESSHGNDSLLQKMNYIIHLLEEQHHEPTQHILEEYILYTFLGVFVIFIVDSFSRHGKYIR